MTRLMVEAAVLVWSVAKVRWPVSAMRSARLDGFEVAHFADEHHVRVLAQRRAQRLGEALGVGADFALVDDAALVRVEELDRVFDGDDVLVALAVDLVEHGGERRRFAGAGRAGDEDEAARAVAERRDDGRQAQRFEGLDLVRDGAEDGADRAALVEEVGAEAREAAHAEGEVEFELLLEAVLLRVGEHAVGERLGVGGGERADAVEGAQVAVNAHLRRRCSSSGASPSRRPRSASSASPRAKSVPAGVPCLQTCLFLFGAARDEGVASGGRARWLMVLSQSGRRSEVRSLLL